MASSNPIYYLFMCDAYTVARVRELERGEVIVTDDLCGEAWESRGPAFAERPSPWDPEHPHMVCRLSHADNTVLPLYRLFDELRVP